jgi:hypothetical protein
VPPSNKLVLRWVYAVMSSLLLSSPAAPRLASRCASRFLQLTQPQTPSTPTSASPGHAQSFSAGGRDQEVSQIISLACMHAVCLLSQLIDALSVADPATLHFSAPHFSVLLGATQPKHKSSTTVLSSPAGHCGLQSTCGQALQHIAHYHLHWHSMHLQLPVLSSKGLLLSTYD